MTGTKNPVRDAALEALRLGWSVMPVNETGLYAKHPHFVLTKTGHSDKRDGKLRPVWKQLQSERATPEHVGVWFHPPQGKGVAVVTGALSGLVILDFDGEEGGRLVAQLGLNPHVQTGSGGYHVYFRHPGHYVPSLNRKAKQELGERWPGLDIRADGGYALMPPSRNESGPYKQLRDFSDLEDIGVLPQDLQEFLRLVQVVTPAPTVVTPSAFRTSGSYQQDAQGRVSADRLMDRALERMNQEGRNNAGLWLAVQLRDNGFSQGETSQVMRAYVQRVPGHNTKGQAEPYTMTDVAATLRNVYSTPAREPWTLRDRTMPTAVPAPTQPQPPRASVEESVPLDLPDEGNVFVGPHNMRSDLMAALRLNQAEPATARTPEELTEEYLTTLRRDQRSVYVIRPSSQLQQTLNRAGVVWEAIDVQETADPAALLASLFFEVDAAAERQVQGDRSYLLEAFPELLNRRAQQERILYPTSFPQLDAALGGGYYPGLHVLGGVTAGGKTAMALYIAESNARAGRPVLYITYEQSRAELWTRILSPRLGIGINTFRAGGSDSEPLGTRLQADARYQEIADMVAPNLRLLEGDGVDRAQQWGVDRIAAEVTRMRAFYGRPPLVILDYLQRMPSERDSDKRHQVDDLVMSLQVRLGRGSETPLLLLSSVSRGNYGELLTRPLDERLSVFKESGGIEYTAYSAMLLYPLAANNALEMGYDIPPTPGSGAATTKGVWRHIIADLVKNREGEAGLQLLVKWWPARGKYEVDGPIDIQKLKAPVQAPRRTDR